jgi:hypothetical protein
MPFPVMERANCRNLIPPASDQRFDIGRTSTALKRQKVEGGRFATGQYRQAGVGLSAMMGLVIGQMQQDICEDLGLGHSRRCFVTVEIRQRCVIVLINDSN